METNVSLGNHFPSYSQSIHQRLNDKLPQHGKQWEISKRVAVAVIQAFLWIFAFMESIPSFLSLFDQRRAMMRKNEIIEQLPKSRGSIFLEKKKKIRQEEERSSIHDPLLIEPRLPLCHFFKLFEPFDNVSLPLEQAEFQDQFQHKRVEEFSITDDSMFLEEGKEVKEEQEELSVEDPLSIESSRPSSHPVEFLQPFDYVNLPKDLQRLVLSFCSSEVKCQLVFVSHFTKNSLVFEVAMGKMEQALDWILRLPDLKKHLMGDQIGIQKLIDHLLKNCQEGRSIDFDNKSSPFMLNVFDLILNHGTDQQIEAFMITLTTRSGCGYSHGPFSFPKSINLFYEHLTRKRLNCILSLPIDNSYSRCFLSFVFNSIEKNHPEISKYKARFRACFSTSLFLADAEFEHEEMEEFLISDDSVLPEEEEKVEQNQEQLRIDHPLSIEPPLPPSHADALFEPFDYVNLPKDLQRLILSFCSYEVKCQLLFVSHFMKKTLQFEVAMGKMQQALDWILTLPDLKKHLRGDHIGIQKLIDHLIKNSQKGGSIDFDSKSSPFMLNVFDLIFNHGTNQQIEVFIKTLTMNTEDGYDSYSFPKSINLFYEHLTRKQLNCILSLSNGKYDYPRCFFSLIFTFIEKNHPEISKYKARLRACFSSSLLLADAEFEAQSPLPNAKGWCKQARR